MKNTTIETLAEDKHQILLSDLGLIQLSDIIDNVSRFGGSRIEQHQKTLNELVETATKSNPAKALEYINTMSYLNEMMLFISLNGNNAFALSEALAPISDKL